MIEFIQSPIEHCIKDILMIGNESFNHFYPREKISERLVDKTYWAILAHDNGIPMGFQISYKEDYGAYFWLLGVRPKNQKIGIGSKLIDLQEELSKRLGHQKIILKTHKEHPDAIRLYSKKGFNHFKTIEGYWGELDALFFEKILNSNL